MTIKAVIEAQIKLINKLVDLEEPSDISICLSDSLYITSGIDYVMKCIQYNHELYANERNIHSVISFEGFLIYLNEFISLLKTNLKYCTRQDYIDLVMKIMNLPDLQYEVLVGLNGLTVDMETINLGQFCLYKSKAYDSILSTRYQTQNLNQEVKEFLNSTPLVGIQVIAKDMDKVFELAENLLSKFEQIIQFYVNDRVNTFNVGIYNRSKCQSTRTIALDSLGTITNQRGNSIIDTCHHTNLYKLERCTLLFEHSPRSLWDLITKKTNRSDFDNRVQLSVELFGKAAIETDNIISYILFCISIEALIKPSRNIKTTRVSLYVAYILSEHNNDRKSIDAIFGSLYDLRSRIVHGSYSMNDVEDIYAYRLQIRDFAHSLILKFTIDEPYCSFRNFKELQNHISDIEHSDLE